MQAPGTFSPPRFMARRLVEPRRRRKSPWPPAMQNRTIAPVSSALSSLAAQPLAGTKARRAPASPRGSSAQSIPRKLERPGQHRSRVRDTKVDLAPAPQVGRVGNLRGGCPPPPCRHSAPVGRVPLDRSLPSCSTCVRRQLRRTQTLRSSPFHQPIAPASTFMPHTHRSMPALPCRDSMGIARCIFPTDSWRRPCGAVCAR